MINPSQVPNWIVVVYERQQRFSDQVANQMAADLVRACESVGAASNQALWTSFNAIFIRDTYECPAVSYKMGIGTRDYSSGLLSHFRFL